MSMRTGNKTLLKGIDHIAIPTKNMDVTVDFYKRIGFSLAFECVNNGCRVCFLSLDNLTIETYEVDTLGSKSGSVDHFAILCSDVSTLYEDLKEEYEIITDGVEKLPFWDNGVRFFKIKGPNSESIEFLERL